jgi:hypothetical protein
MGLEANPCKGEMPRWESAVFTSHNGLKRFHVWFNCQTGLIEVMKVERDTLEASWGSLHSWQAID